MTKGVGCRIVRDVEATGNTRFCCCLKKTAVLSRFIHRPREASISACNLLTTSALRLFFSIRHALVRKVRSRHRGTSFGISSNPLAINDIRIKKVCCKQNPHHEIRKYPDKVFAKLANSGPRDFYFQIFEF